MSGRGRVGALAAAFVGTAVGLELLLTRVAQAQWRVVLEPGPARPDEVVAAVAATAAVALATWLGVSVLASLGAHLPGRLGRLARGWAAACAPAFTRRMAAVLVGATVGSVLAPTSAAGGSGPAPQPGFAVTAEAAGPTRFEPTRAQDGPGWTPTRPVERPQVSPRLVAGLPAATPSDVVVHRGDTLWSIAARHLGPDATDAEVAEAWPRWYAANRDVIGDDPDRLLPGQVLIAPAASREPVR